MTLSAPGYPLDPSKKGWYTYAKDQVGTVYQVFDETTRVKSSMNYDTFGNLVNQAGSSKGHLAFQGKYYDSETGLYYFYHRYYNPTLGRFMTEDPIGFGGGLNFYGFVNNNPVKLIDTYGLDWTQDHPDWVDLACLLFRMADMGKSQNEFGAWLDSDEIYIWDTSNWWQPAGDGAAGTTIPRGRVCGSMHTHPTYFPNSFSRTRPYRPESGDDQSVQESYWNRDLFGRQQPMYVISSKGIWSLDKEIMSYKELSQWCKCRGLWD